MGLGKMYRCASTGSINITEEKNGKKTQKMQVGTSSPVGLDPVIPGREHEIASDSATDCITKRNATFAFINGTPQISSFDLTRYNTRNGIRVERTREKSILHLAVM